jgi:3-methyladenine DNA glycosylase AlkC
MAVEPFKNLISAPLVRASGAHLQRAWRGFDRAAFERVALPGLETLELKARAMRVADALEASLPDDFARGADVLVAALAPPLPDGELATLDDGARDDGLTGWAVWPATEWVARRGLADPARALAALHAMTQRFTAEWAIRPFLLAHPRATFATLERWTRDDSAHVRRLVSEGSRPRLPWGLQLKPLIADPSPTLPLLRALQDDASDYVRRSVANHLNDIAKDHPALVAGWLAEHLPGASAERRALLRHASRTLIKRGDAQVLAHWGVGGALKGRALLAVAPRALALGESLSLQVTLSSSARRAQALLIDYAVHHVKADGSTSPKVFKGWQIELAAGETRVLTKAHPVRPITTRRYHAGTHRVELLVNGRAVADARFELRL